MKVSLFYTNICNINCEHCFINKSLPKKRMEESLLIKILQEICQEKDRVRLISISGGEPMLFLDDIIELIKKNEFEQKLTFSISSNAYWASTMGESNKVCKSLLRANINRLEISYDLFHAKYIDIKNILNVIEACRKFGITLYIIFSIANGYDYLPLYAELSKLIDKKKIILQHVANYGNAQHYGLDCILPITAFKDQKCNQILNPCIDYNANFYACCGANILRQDSPMLVGNMRDDSFEALVDKMNNSQLYQRILSEGPLQLYRMLDNIKECSSLCELCDFLV